MQRWLEAQTAPRVVLDLSHVRMLAACGARRLIEAQHTLVRRKQTLHVVVAGDPVLARVLRLVGRLEIFDSVTEAWEPW